MQSQFVSGCPPSSDGDISDPTSGASPNAFVMFPCAFARRFIFPQRLFDFVFGDVCGLYTVMNHFTGRKA